MRIRPVWLMVGMVLILVVPTPARADGHRSGLFFGYSAAEGSVLHGFNVSFDHVPKIQGNKYFAAMADFSAHETGRKILTGGVNISRRFTNAVFSGHGLVGGVWGDGSSDAAGTFGLDVEVIAAKKTLGGKDVEFAPMARADYILRGGPAPSFWRVSTGLAVRWAQ